MADLIKVSTPIGKLMWVNITGQGKLNFNEDGREYVASVVLSKKAAKPLLDAIKEAYDLEHQKGKTLRSVGYKPCDEDGKADEDEDEDGEYYSFNFKTSTTFQDGKSKKITVFNSKAQKVDIGDTRIGNGSEGAISGSMRYYINGKSDGMSLWLNAVQITKLEEYIEDAGFEEQGDGGFEGVEDEETGFKGQPENHALPEDDAPSKGDVPAEGTKGKTAKAKPRL